MSSFLVTIRIRTAQKSDVKHLRALAIETYTDSFGGSMTASDLAANLETHLSESRIVTFIKKEVVLVAELKERMVGYVHFSDINMPVETPACRSKKLRRLSVHRDFQNRGIGSALMNAALEHPMLKEAEYIYLDAWEHNHGAQRFYERFRFKKIDQQRFVLPSGAVGDFDYIYLLEKDKLKMPGEAQKQSRGR
jgi:diamine N-acetyltransferase